MKANGKNKESAEEMDVPKVHTKKKNRRHSNSNNQNTTNNNNTEKFSWQGDCKNEFTMTDSAEVLLYSFEAPVPQYNERTVLPSVMLSRDQISIWSILKHSIGKDLTRITMPIEFNEPLSFLQRLAEHMEYVELLKKAAITDDPVKRIELIAAFSISSLASNRDRVAKPFNPMLGETYELDRQSDLGFRYVSEQVMHHPPVSAFHVEGDSFKYYGSCCPRIKFFGQTVDCHMKGVDTLELSKYNEVYTWGSVCCTVHNLVMGKMYIEHSGTIEVKCAQTNLLASVTLKPNGGWFSKGDSPSFIQGHVHDKNKKKLRCFYGDWSEFLASCDPETFDKHFAAWGKEHKEQKDKTRLTPNARQHSPPPNRRFSVTPEDVAAAAQGQGTHLNEPVGWGGTVLETDLYFRGKCGKNADWWKLSIGQSPFPPVFDIDHSPFELIGLKERHGAQGRRLTMSSAVSSGGQKVTQVLPLLAGSDVLWRANTRPDLSDQFYHFTMFSLLLNEMNDRLMKELPPTDSRRRPDIRLMEQADIDQASAEKHRLEEKQRAVAADKKRSKEEYVSKWFKSAPHPHVKGEEVWVFDEKYWQRDWTNCEMIFDD